MTPRFAAFVFIPVAFVVAGVVATLLIAGGLRGRRALAKVGDVERVKLLRTHDASILRAWRGALLVAAVFCAFVAAAQPQYGQGTRVIPRTNIDVVVVLDYSKSMYAQDVKPSRIKKAKIEVGDLIDQLHGARFGGVAFAGKPFGFPLTAQGSSISSFFKRQEPENMPVGGTAIARALRQAHDMLNRDKLSRNHKRVIVLVTDGEDLSGNPVRTARNIGDDDITIHVVQIGGRTAERIPRVVDGKVVGWERTPAGAFMTTELSSRAENQLEEIAKATPGGRLIRAEEGSTGIGEITQQLKKQMKSELSEKVETDWADIFWIPLLLALFLLLVETFLPEGPYRRFVRPIPPPKMHRKVRRPNRREVIHAPP